MGEFKFCSLELSETFFLNIFDLLLVGSKDVKSEEPVVGLGGEPRCLIPSLIFFHCFSFQVWPPSS